MGWFCQSDRSPASLREYRLICFPALTLSQSTKLRLKFANMGSASTRSSHVTCQHCHRLTGDLRLSYWFQIMSRPYLSSLIPDGFFQLNTPSHTHTYTHRNTHSHTSLQRSKTSSKKGVLRMTQTCIQWWGSNSVALLP